MKNEQLFGFEELEIWKKSRVFKQQVAEMIKGFPADERYKLSDQLLRSSRSINSLLAVRTWETHICRSDTLLYSGKRLIGRIIQPPG